ncbi:MAG: NTP transferase domain-containing protein [Peptococcaceae bacterium]|nr:NTP transferase domain-containing protein [Candidatus Syntrophopropionicum ammoniitolerans]
MVDAVVLAGSPNNGPLRECSTVSHEALIPLGAKTMVEYVVDALLRARQVGRVLVIGPTEDLAGLPFDQRTSTAPSQGGILENIGAGLNILSDAKRILLVTSDIPLLTPQAVDDFLELCEDMGGDLYFPVIEKMVVEEKFPAARRTYVKLKEGVFTGGNIFLLNPTVYKKCMENGGKIISLRKSPLALCRMLGVRFVIKFLMHLLTLKEAEEKVCRLLGGIKGVVVVSRYPEVGVDVDKPGDYELVLKAIKRD